MKIIKSSTFESSIASSVCILWKICGCVNDCYCWALCSDVSSMCRTY